MLMTDSVIVRPANELLANMKTNVDKVLFNHRVPYSIDFHTASKLINAEVRYQLYQDSLWQPSTEIEYHNYLIDAIPYIRDSNSHLFKDLTRAIEYTCFLSLGNSLRNKTVTGYEIWLIDYNRLVTGNINLIIRVAGDSRIEEWQLNKNRELIDIELGLAENVDNRWLKGNE